MDDEHDDITKWAAGLSPEGAPGIWTQNMRTYLGDAGYEKVVAYNDTISDLELQKKTAINNILSLVVLYGVLFGLVAFVAAVTLLIKFIF